MKEIEDNECFNCYCWISEVGELFCSDECYDEWHHDNPDYYWSEEQQNAEALHLFETVAKCKMKQTGCEPHSF